MPGNPLRNLVRKGKINQGNPLRQRFINISMMSGFLFLFIWSFFLHKNVFIPIYTVIAILIIPGLVLSVFISKWIIESCGYSSYKKGNLKYNVLIYVLASILVIMPVGNFLVFSFLLVNRVFCEESTEIRNLIPFKAEERKPRSGNYSQLYVELDGIPKTINMGSTPVEVLNKSTLVVEVSKGLFGYYIIRKRKLERL